MWYIEFHMAKLNTYQMFFLHYVECDISEDVMEICIQEVSNTIKGSPATDSNFVETDLIAMSDI